ncbi:MAG: low-specificity L-threonine aldolase [Verrucomicrobiales bacterium]|nr:low-specificity L-threonine aldolase [Verrucomicrobiales bacterium]
MIDLRSDTVTRPTDEMRKVMASASVGDDVFREDPTVRELEGKAAAMLGKEDALFAPSATQSNLIALLTHCQRGDEFIVGQEAHNYLYESGGAAALGGIQPQPLWQKSDGTLDLNEVQQVIKPDDFHFARTRLLSLENTTWGKVLPEGYGDLARTLADAHDLKMHLDGARLFNAVVASGERVDLIAAPFDSISVCLSKGLGAPVGSLLVGGAEFIEEGRRWRKMLGGGMRQSGILAAAGIYALDHHIERLEEDHEKARVLAKGLEALGGLSVDPVQTNMVFVSLPSEMKEGIDRFFSESGIRIGGYISGKLRLVTHLDVSLSDMEKVIATFRDWKAQSL